MRDTILAILHAAREGVDLEALADKLIDVLPRPRRLITAHHLSLWSVCLTVIMVVALCVFPHNTKLRSDGKPSLAQNMRVIAGRSAATWYVRTDGNDHTGCGAVDAAWNGSTGGCASLAYVTAARSNLPHTTGFQEQYDRAVPGDTIIMDCGTYGPQLVQFFNANFTTTWIRDTTNQTTIRAATQSGTCVTITYPTNPSAVVQEGSLIGTSDAYTILWDGRGVVLTGMKGRADENFGAPSGTTYHSVGIGLSPVDGQTDGSIIQNFTISHIDGKACIYSQGDTNQILNNTLTDCGTADSFLEHGMYLHGSSLTVTGNTVNGAQGWCLQHYGAGGTSTFANNTFSNCREGGMTTYQPSDTVTGNVIHDNAGGFYTNATSTTVQQNALYANNTNDVAAAIGTNGAGAGSINTHNMWTESGITGVLNGAEQDVWVASTALGTIRRFKVSDSSQQGSDISLAGVAGLGTVTENGTTEVWALTGAAIYRYQANGTLIGSFADHDGHASDLISTGTTAYVTEGSPTNAVSVYSTSGVNPSWSADRTNANLSSPRGIAYVPCAGGQAGCTGNALWVASNGNSEIVQMDPTTGATIGSVLTPQSTNQPNGQLGTCAQGQGLLWGSPIGLAWFNNHIYAIGSNHHGMVVYNNDQTFVGTYITGTAFCGGGFPQTAYDLDYGQSAAPSTQAPVAFYNNNRLAVIGSQLWMSVSAGFQETANPSGLSGSNDGGSVFYNNTLYQNGFVEIYQGAGYAPTPVAKNNIIYGSGSTDYPVLRWDGQTVDYNDYYNTASTAQTNGGTIAANGGTHSITSDPTFVTNGSDFHLQAGSPAIAAGLAQGSLTGYTGSPLNSPADLGAYQYGVTPTPTPTPGPTSTPTPGPTSTPTPTPTNTPTPTPTNTPTNTPTPTRTPTPTVTPTTLPLTMTQNFDSYTLNATPPFSASANDFTGGANTARIRVASDVTAHSGAQHLRYPIHAGGYSYLYKTFGGAAYTTFDVTIYVRLSANWSVPSADSMTLLRLGPVYTGPGPGDPLPKGTVSVRLTGAGVLTCHYLDGVSGADTTVTSSDTLTADGAWHKIEVRDIVANSIGSLAFTEDATTATASSINTGTVGISAFLLGMINGTTHAALVGNLYADDLTVQST